MERNRWSYWVGSQNPQFIPSYVKLMKTGFFYKRNSKLCHTFMNVIITSKEMRVPLDTSILYFGELFGKGIIDCLASSTKKPFHKRKWYSGNEFGLHNLRNPHNKVGCECTWTRLAPNCVWWTRWCHHHPLMTKQSTFGKPSLKVSGPQSLKSWVHLRHPSDSCIGSGRCLVRLGMVDDT